MYYSDNVNENVVTKETTVKQEFSLSKVFGWLFVAMLVTLAVACGLAAFIQTGLISADVYLILMIVAIVLMFIESIVINIMVMKNTKRGLVVPYILYAVSMGIMISSIFAVVNTWLILVAFGVSASMFGVLALYGYITKKDLNTLGSIAFMFLCGGLILSLINWLIGSEAIGWISSFVTFGAILLFVSFDMAQVKKIAEAGTGSKNICLYCALQLYVDFMYIFMQVLRILIVIYNNKN